MGEGSLSSSGMMQSTGQDFLSNFYAVVQIDDSIFLVPYCSWCTPLQHNILGREASLMNRSIDIVRQDLASGPQLF